MKTFKIFGSIIFFSLMGFSLAFGQWVQSSPGTSTNINRPGTISVGNLVNFGEAKFHVNHDSDQIFNMLIHNPRGAARLLRLKGGWPGGTQNIFQVEGNQTSGSNYVEGNIIFVIQPNKRVGILTDDPQEALHIEGGNFLISNDNGVNNFRVDDTGFVRARQIDVDLDIIPDYVFEPDYKLMSLEELDTYIKINKHLPGIKSAKEYEDIGSINLSELNLQLLEKVEELTLYILEMKAEMEQMKKQLKEETSQE